MAENRGPQHGQPRFGTQQGGQQGSQQSGQGQQGGAAGVLEGVKGRAGEMASNLGESAQQAWDSARQGVQQAAGRLGVDADTFNDVRGFMRRYPIATFAAGFGLGVLVTMMFGRGRSY
jgi:hypothetical protein